MRKFVIVVLVLVGGSTLYNLDAIYGSWKFDKLCETEGGPRFLGVVEPNKAWQINPDNPAGVGIPLSMGQVEFVRYTDQSGKRFDVRLDGTRGPAGWNRVTSPADETKPVRYELSHETHAVPGDARFQRFLYKVVDLETGQTVATHTILTYSWTTPDRVLLAAPTGKSCWDDAEGLSAFKDNIYFLGAKK